MRYSKDVTDLDRLYRKVFFDPNSGCWLFVGSYTTNGYGLLMNANRIVTTAHRVSWELHKRKIPLGMSVLHKCDVRCCVNPEHLFLGTNDENVADKVTKGRQWHPKGERNYFALLKETEAREIKNSNKTNDELANIYNISSWTVKNIKSGKSWKHL
jgi:hypothetical protein